MNILAAILRLLTELVEQLKAASRRKRAKESTDAYQAVRDAKTTEEKDAALRKLSDRYDK